jgi:hypothetical protein
MNCCCTAKVTLNLGALLGQDVTLEGLTTLDAATSADFEALFGAALSLHFGHFLLLNDMPSGGSRREHFHYPKALMGTTTANYGFFLAGAMIMII